MRSKSNQFKKITLIVKLLLSGACLLHLSPIQADSAKLVNPANNHSYKRFDTIKTWANAKTACASQGGYLATITSKAENDWIVNNHLPISGNWVWLGGNDATVEGTWKWITGEAFTYTHWYPGQPDNADAGQDYLALLGSGYWGDIGLPNYNAQKSYLCEWNPPPKNIVLFLHGMNSNPATWNSVITQYFPNGCPVIYNGTISATAIPNAQKTYCYRIKYGAFDAASPYKGLEDAWVYGETNGYVSAGDYSTFNQLGVETSSAVVSIRRALPNARILLVGHSRGGLAGRAFLQNTALNRGNVVGLMTTGTPHGGTRIGRFYNYMTTYMFNEDGSRKNGWLDYDAKQNWQVVDLLRQYIKCDYVFRNKDFMDARRPTVAWLADWNSMIADLNNNKSKIPTTLKYGQLIYDGVHLGLLARPSNLNYNLFDESGIDICDQVTGAAEAYIKGGTASSPTPSTNYPGDGIVPTASQNLAVFPTSRQKPYSVNVLHTDEPNQTAHIAEMICGLGFKWVSMCPATATATLSAKAEIAPAEIVSHDYDALTALKTEQLWQNWLAVSTHDAKTNDREQLAVALGMKLRQQESAALYADMEQRLFSINANALERARLAKLLAEIATPQALQILIQALLHPEKVTTDNAVRMAIQDLADSLPENPRRAQLSTILENAWTTPQQNQQQLNTLALGLAKLGTARGVDLLLHAIEKTGATLPSVKNKVLNDAEKQTLAAFNAMPEIINPESETVLANAFMRHRANEAVFIAAGSGLVNLGRESAVQVVLKRLNEIPENNIGIAQQWLNGLSGKIEKPTLQRLNKAVGMPKQPILQQQMRKILK